MDPLNRIKQPIEAELQTYKALFDEALTHENDFLGQALSYVRRRKGKMMRPQLVLLTAKEQGEVTVHTQRAAVALELLHTASLVHDDVVDESAQRRGQQSVNALYDNKVAVLVGDYILSTALLHVARTGSERIVTYLAELGRTLSDGEILQLSNIGRRDISEEVYYDVIKQKTAALFEACCGIGALSAGASDEDIAKAKQFGQNLGVIFQIRDDIFDYYDSPQIGKPTGNDMAEGKLTLPVIYAVNSANDPDMTTLAFKVKDHTASQDEIARLVAFAKEHGGIEYAEQRMEQLHAEAVALLDSISRKAPDSGSDGSCGASAVKAALMAYLDFVIKREK